VHVKVVIFVSYDHVMSSQELLDILNEAVRLLFDLNIVALCVPKLEQFRKSHGDGCFSLIRRSVSP